MSRASIHWIGGPVLRARPEGVFHIYESVNVGRDKLLGEVIRVTGNEIVAQVYEDTTGLRPGDAVVGTGAPLTVGLGPGLLGGIFDGLLRPLACEGAEQFVRPGGQDRAPRGYGFKPLAKVGDTLTAGAAFGEIEDGVRKLQCQIPSDGGGQVEWLAEAGEYLETAPLCTVSSVTLSMVQQWPVRRPRPVAARLPVSSPMITGQRVLDTLFPIAKGSRAMLPGGFGSGKTVLQETLAKWSDADVIVYVGCGERGNEMAGVLREFAELEDPRTGQRLMERTVIIANTSNMPVAAREASIYTGATVAEFFRDQGLHVALMADSTSRWAEALREVSGRLGELPGESGYPAYLSSRLAEFYERAGRVDTLSGKEGSLTIIGSVSPPAGDFSEPVTMHSKRYIRCFWGLDRTLAQARFYPAINPLHSYSDDTDALSPWWRKNGNPDWQRHRQKLLLLLEEAARIERLARIVGKDVLPPRQQLILMFAELINEGFLHQMATSHTDSYCSPTRQTAMLRLIMHLVDLAEAALEEGASLQDMAELPILLTLRRMSETLGEDRLDDFKPLWGQMETAFGNLKRGQSDAG